MPIFVGLDCGGSATRVLGVDQSGSVLFRGHAGSSNLLSTPNRILSANIRKAAEGCPAADAVCACFAGMVNEETAQQARSLISSAFAGACVRVEPDYAAVLAAWGDQADLCVIAGTGSIVCSATKSGWVKSGGRGPLLGDPGSASEVGREALVRLLDRDSGLTDAFLLEVERIFGSAEPSSVIAALYAARSPAAMLARLVGPVGNEAARGNKDYQALIRQEMAELAAVVVRHVTKFLPGQDTMRVGLSGGLWKSHVLYFQLFKAEVEDLMPSFRVSADLLSKPPVEGAVELAKELIRGH